MAKLYKETGLTEVQVSDPPITNTYPTFITSGQGQNSLRLTANPFTGLLSGSGIQPASQYARPASGLDIPRPGNNRDLSDDLEYTIVYIEADPLDPGSTEKYVRIPKTIVEGYLRSTGDTLIKDGKRYKLLVKENVSGVNIPYL